MCRWMAYAGEKIYLENLLFLQKNSLISQSLKATKSSFATSGDGFGLAWYGGKKTPGLFKDVLPAWNDENLRQLSQHVKSGLFLAHVRASTGTGVSRANCHPFACGKWSFMHNGQIGNWSLLRRDIESMISKDYYNYRLGTTDSEALFLLALSCGLEKDPVGGIKKAIEKIHILLEAYGATEPLRFSAALSDGKSIWAFRYSSDHQSPSLYYGTPDLHKKQGQSRMINTIASEPFDDDSEHWTSVGESKVILWKNKAVSVSSFI